jgi:hypothetical protein
LLSDLLSCKICLFAKFLIDLEQFDKREPLRKSDLGKVYFVSELQFWKVLFRLSTVYLTADYILFDVQVIMFLSKSDEDTTSSRKLAMEIVYKWVIFFSLSICISC